MEMMEESRQRLLLRHGEFGPIILRLILREGGPDGIVIPPGFRTAWTDGKTLGFFPEFMEKLACPDCGGNACQYDTIQIHEGLHVALLHSFSQRSNGLRDNDLQLFFEAEDHVVNNIALEAGFHPIKGWVCDTKYAGWSLEEVFEDLKKQGRKGQQTTDYHLTPVDENSLSAEEKAELEQLKREWKQALTDVVTLAKQKGTLGAGLQKLLDETLESKVPWVRILVDKLTRTLGHNDTTWSRPSRRGRVLDIYLPSCYDQKVDCVAFLFDTSGSMWNDPLLREAFTEMKACLEQVHVKRGVLIEADVEVTREEVIEDRTLLSTTVKGGGGTSFVHALKAAEAYEPQLTVYFTDMCGDFPRDYPYRLLWVTKSDIIAPLGETMKIS